MFIYIDSDNEDVLTIIIVSTITQKIQANFLASVRELMLVVLLRGAARTVGGEGNKGSPSWLLLLSGLRRSRPIAHQHTRRGYCCMLCRTMFLRTSVRIERSMVFNPYWRPQENTLMI